MEQLDREFQDKEIVCEDCNTSFAFTADEQQFYQDKGFTHEPKRCKPCRVARKTQVRDQRVRSPQAAPQGGRFPSDPMGQGHTPLFKADFGPIAGRSPHPDGRRADRGRRFKDDFRSGRRGPGRSGNRAPGGASEYRPDVPPSPWERSPVVRGGVRSPGRQAMRRYEAVCTDCGAGTQVPFRPNGVSPVYCRTCLPKHKSRRGRPPAHGGNVSREE